MTTGRFIVVEGIDGSGSTTIVEQLTSHFRAMGRAVHRTCEPSGGPVGAMIRQILSHRMVLPGSAGGGSPGWETMALLFAADRLDHLEAEVRPALARGAMVISDRYDLSSLAYQSATAPPGDPARREEVTAWIRELNRPARRPDLTLVLDVRAEVAAQRRASRGGAERALRRARVASASRRGVRDSEKLVPGDRLVHIDGNQPVASVFAAALAAIEQLG